jgi:hypothetical protein
MHSSTMNSPVVALTVTCLPAVLCCAVSACCVQVCGQPQGGIVRSTSGGDLTGSARGHR